MRIRAVILLALLLVSQLLGTSMTSRGESPASCKTGAVRTDSCCAPGHCHCKATPKQSEQPTAPLAPAPAGKDVLPTPAFIPLAELTAPAASVRTLGVSHISRVFRVMPPSVRRNTLFCTFLI